MKRPRPLQHIGLKLLALGLGVLLWMVVSGEATVERVLRVPLELQRFPAGLELQTEAPSNVDVRVRGGSGTLSRLSPADIVAVVDLNGARAGQRLFHVTPNQVRVPFGVEIVQISPSTVALMFENSATKPVRVVPAYDGKPAPGFIVGKVTSLPETVEIVGPESSVKRGRGLDRADLGRGAREAVRGRVGRCPRFDASSQELRHGGRDRSNRAGAIRAHRSRAACSVAQSLPISLAVRAVCGRRQRAGAREGLNRIGVDDVSAFVDVTGLSVGEYSLPVHAESRAEAGSSKSNHPSAGANR